MLLRLSDSLSRAVVVVASLALAGVVSYLALRMALAAYDARQDQGDWLRAATHREPRNPEYWFRLGHFEQFNLDEPDPTSALQSLQLAVALYPEYTDAWLDLATAHELEGDTDAARQDYIRAKNSYPKSAEVAWRRGNFLLRVGDLPPAFREIRQAIQLEPSRAAAAFSRVYRADPNLDEILDLVLPPIPSVYVDVMREATATKQLGLAQTVWARLLALKPALHIQDFDPLVKELAADKDYVMAGKVWEQGATTLRLRSLYRPEGSVVWDPSFESGIEGYMFSWHYKALEEGVRISLDSGERISGTQSLRLSFDGKHNPGMEAACIASLVNPSTNYRFTTWIKTRDLTTEQGVSFRIRSLGEPTNPVVNTREFHGSTQWTPIDMRWYADASTHRVQICVCRDPSDNPDVRISGNAWIDDVNLVPEATMLPQP
jgi:tetratricopeptide (TPR) repeat protein